MRLFKVGDSVEVIDEIMKGVVLGVSQGEITIESEDGFVMKYAPNELVNTSDVDDIRVTNYQVAKIKAEKESTKRKQPTTAKSKERNAPKWKLICILISL